MTSLASHDPSEVRHLATLLLKIKLFATIEGETGAVLKVFCLFYTNELHI